MQVTQTLIISNEKRLGLPKRTNLHNSWTQCGDCGVDDATPESITKWDEEDRDSESLGPQMER